MVRLEITSNRGLVDNEMSPEGFAPVTCELECVLAADKVLDLQWDLRIRISAVFVFCAVVTERIDLFSVYDKAFVGGAGMATPDFEMQVRTLQFEQVLRHVNQYKTVRQGLRPF